MSDLEKFDEAYTDFSALTDGVDPQTLERDGSGHPNDEVPGIDLPGGMKALYSLANVPKSWPLARLTIPLSAASKHLVRLLEGCCMEIFVRNTNPDSQLHFVRKFAKDLVVVFAFIWLRQFLRCFGMYWIILARSSMIQRLSPCSYLFSGSTPFTERCLIVIGMNLAWWYLVTTTSMISSAYTQAFLDAFASLGIEPWAGIEMDVAWGQTTLRFGLHRPSVTGPIFVYRVCTAFRQDTPTPISPLTSYSVSLQDSIQTCVILGLMDGGSCVPLMPPVGIQGIGV